MALSEAVKDSRHTAQQITWEDKNDEPVDLTTAVITGIITEWNDPTTGRAVDGSMVASTQASGIFDWTYGAIDVGTAGKFAVQFFATYPDNSIEISIIEEWRVREKLSVP